MLFANMPVNLLRISGEKAAVNAADPKTNTAGWMPDLLLNKGSTSFLRIPSPVLIGFILQAVP